MVEIDGLLLYKFIFCAPKCLLYVSTSGVASVRFIENFMVTMMVLL